MNCAYYRLLPKHEEITHYQTDARSILFLVSDSRLKLRVLTTLSLTSIMYVGTAQIMDRYIILVNIIMQSFIVNLLYNNCQVQCWRTRRK